MSNLVQLEQSNQGRDAWKLAHIVETIKYTEFLCYSFLDSAKKLIILLNQNLWTYILICELYSSDSDLHVPLGLSVSSVQQNRKSFY
jgi:hypothetical protein